MTGRRHDLPESELILLQQLWEQAPLGATDLHDRLESSRAWSLTTVKTLLARLVARGAVEAQRDGRRYLYSPVIDHDDVAGRQAGGLVDRLFGGRVSPLVAQLAEQREISAEDLDELDALIRRLRK